MKINNLKFLKIIVVKLNIYLKSYALLRPIKYIKRNISLYVALILIIKKLNEKLRIYVNYKILNALIIRNKNIFSLIRKILIKLYIIK